MKMLIDIAMVEHLIKCIEIQKNICLLPKAEQEEAQDLVNKTVIMGNSIVKKRKCYVEKTQELILNTQKRKQLLARRKNSGIPKKR